MNLLQLFCASCQEIPLGSFHSIVPQIKPFSGFLPNQTYRPLASVKQSAETGCRVCSHIIECLPSHRLYDDLVVCLTAERGPQGAPTYHLSLFTPENQDARHAQASSWIKDCIQNHPDCALRVHHQEPFMPTRLIDLGLSKPNSKPRLLLTNNCELRDRRYIALSHSWGLKMPDSAKTLKDNLDLRLQEIPETTLPLSFQDAFGFSRSLGVNYVWIDSLCIIQDSKDDWRRESTTMNRVYTHSWCTLAVAYQNTTNPRTFESNVLQFCRYLASGGFSQIPIEARLATIAKAMAQSITYQGPQTDVSIAKNTLMRLLKLWTEPLTIFPLDAERLFQERMQRRLDWIDALNSIPLHSRGWTLQERELSPRVFHLTPATILWECRSLRASESFPRGFSDHGALWHGLLGELTPVSRYRLLDIYPTEKDPPTFGIAMTLKFREGHDDTYNSWLRAVEDYSQRNLTFCSDKFPAISGLALEVQALTGSDYIAGLWRGDFHRGLLWRNGITSADGHRGPGRLPKMSLRQLLDYPIRDDTSLCFAPSWSWAASSGPLSYDLVNVYKSGVNEQDGRLPKILEVSISTVGSNPWAPLLEGAFIILSGRLKPLSRLHEVCSSHKFKVSYDTGWDNTEDEVFVLLVRFTDQNLGWFMGHFDCGIGLALKRTGKGIEEYKRIGVVSNISLSAFDDIEDKTIMIV